MHSHGKTTLLRHIAERLFDVPPGIDILYCEQEVVADETTAVRAVLRADTRCTELLAECKKLEEAQEKGTGEDVTERLNEVSGLGGVNRGCLIIWQFTSNIFFLVT